jgi:hypothetical protein
VKTISYSGGKKEMNLEKESFQVADKPGRSEILIAPFMSMDSLSKLKWRSRTFSESEISSLGVQSKVRASALCQLSGKTLKRKS